MPDIRIADISEFQSNLDAPAYLGGGYRCIIIRAHNGSRPDNLWPARRDYVRQFPFAAVGYYQYLQKGRDAAQQARDFISTIGGLRANEFPILDHEEGAGGQVARAEAWFAVVDPWAGFSAALYAGQSFGNTQLGGWARWKRPRWIASYSSREPSEPHELWQNTDRGSFPGLAGGVDGSIFHGAAEQFLAAMRPGAPPPPKPEQEEIMIASAVADNGNLHTFIATPDAVYYSWQGANSTDWSGATGGYPAGMSRFAAAPEGHKITGISAVKAANGVLHVFVRSEDGAAWVSWQPAGQTSWSGGQPGQAIAAFSHFAAPPK